MKPLLSIAFVLLAVVARADTPKLTVYPTEIKLDSLRAQQQLIVLGETDLTREAKYTIAKPELATVDASGIVRPVANGNTTLTVTAKGMTATLPIVVTNATANTPVNFSTEIEPILTKAGCNGGGCHGAQHGRGGFRLSLFAFDPAFDHEQIVLSNESRRIVLNDPERSILLSKPSLVTEHGGGEKLKLGSREYRTLLQWLDDGVPAPTTKEVTVTKLEVFPTHRVMNTQEQQQLAVTATWSDGRREDVTTLAQFDSLNDAVAAVSQNGFVTAKAQGETHVMIRFMGQATISAVTLPFAKLKDYPKTPANNFIDEKLIAKWRDLGITPSPLTTDAEFLRRLYLDAIGTLPKSDETRKFLADTDPKKREKAVEAVLNRPEFIDWWALKWGDLLRINRQALDEKGMWSFHNWVRASVRDNKPADEFARDILTAEGSTYTEGPANFFRVARSADEWAEATSQVFLGVRVQCAKCHHHPFEKWSQDDYYGMTAFFARLGTKNSQEFGIFTRETVIFLRPTGEATHPRKRGVVKPHPFDGPDMDDEFDRRKKLADWMTTAENPFFAKNIVNRFWGYTMGRGLVEPLDDMRATNPACNPELLDALAKDFIANKFDTKHLLRTIFNSRAYQLSSNVTDGNKADAANTHFARYTTKRLTAEQMADAIDHVTGTQEKYVGLPLGTRAIQLPDPQVRSYLLDTFGRPARQVVCECERTTKPNIAQAMHLLNGDFLSKKIADANGRIEGLTKSKTKPETAIEELYLATIGRVPSKDEFAKAQSWVGSAATPKEGLQDLMWVLLNSREFLFNH